MKLKKIYLLLLCVAYIPTSWVFAANTREKYEFDPEMLAGEHNINLSGFAYKNVVQPGDYATDVWINSVRLDKMSVHFQESTLDAVPCFSLTQIKRMGIAILKLTPEAQDLLTNLEHCTRLDEIMPDTSANFDSLEFRLDISVPQIFITLHDSDEIAPSAWENGINGFRLNYDYGVYKSETDNGGYNTSYLSLDAGLNFNGWRFRQRSAMNIEPQGRHFQVFQSYLQTDFSDLGGQLTIGSANTPGQLFDSIGLDGIQFATDERMLPNSRSGYAPVVRGVARTNAKIVIFQGGTILDQRLLPAGPFEIDDLYPTGYAGDLKVVLTEADGQVTTFTLPYSSSVQLLRLDAKRYSFAVGKVHSLGLHDTPLMAELTYQRGVTNDLTLSAGLQGAEAYWAGLVGIGLNTKLGALAATMTVAQSNVLNTARSLGESWQLSYSKLLPNTNTSIGLVGYRFSNKKYWSLNDAVQAKSNYSENIPINLVDKQKNRIVATINQRLGERGGAFYFSGSVNNFWNKKTSDVGYQFGYSHNIAGITYNASVGRVTNNAGREDNRYSLNISIPFGGRTNSTLTSNVVRGGGASNERVSFGGAVGKMSELTYATTLSKDQSRDNTIAASGAYRSPYANLTGSYATSSAYKQTSFGISGGLVAHSEGITFGQPLGETTGLVKAKDAEGASITNATGVSVDSSGFAIVPYLIPYRKNEIGLDPQGLPLDVQLESSTVQSVPRAGAIVELKFDVHKERSAILHGTLVNGGNLPFGAEVVNTSGTVVGVVEQSGMMFVRGLDSEAGVLSVRLPDQSTCRMNYILPPKNLTTDSWRDSVKQPIICQSNTPNERK